MNAGCVDVKASGNARWKATRKHAYFKRALEWTRIRPARIGSVAVPLQRLELPGVGAVGRERAPGVQFAKRAADLDNGDAMVEIGRITLYRRLFDEERRSRARVESQRCRRAGAFRTVPCIPRRRRRGTHQQGNAAQSRVWRLVQRGMTLALFVMGRYKNPSGSAPGCPTSLSTVRRFSRPH